MNELVIQQNRAEIAVSTETKKLIQSSIADSTLERYRRLSEQIGAWLGGQALNDGLLATYITELHQQQIPCHNRAGGCRGEVVGKEPWCRDRW